MTSGGAGTEIYETALFDGSVAAKRKRPLLEGGALRSNP
jgi:hypothetical protein